MFEVINKVGSPKKLKASFFFLRREVEDLEEFEGLKKKRSVNMDIGWRLWSKFE